MTHRAGDPALTIFSGHGIFSEAALWRNERLIKKLIDAYLSFTIS